MQPIPFTEQALLECLDHIGKTMGDAGLPEVDERLYFSSCFVTDGEREGERQPTPYDPPEASSPTQHGDVVGENVDTGRVSQEAEEPAASESPHSQSPEAAKQFVPPVFNSSCTPESLFLPSMTPSPARLTASNTSNDRELTKLSTTGFRRDDILELDSRTVRGVARSSSIDTGVDPTLINPIGALVPDDDDDDDDDAEDDEAMEGDDHEQLKPTDKLQGAQKAKRDNPSQGGSDRKRQRKGVPTAKRKDKKTPRYTVPHRDTRRRGGKSLIVEAPIQKHLSMKELLARPFFSATKALEIVDLSYLEVF